MLSTLLLFAQLVTVSVCDGPKELSVTKGQPVNLCFQQDAAAGVDIQYFRLRRSPLITGLFTHYHQILPAQAQPVSISYTDLAGQPQTLQTLKVEHTFNPSFTYFYCVSTVYKDAAGAQQETLCSEQIKVTVTKP